MNNLEWLSVGSAVLVIAGFLLANFRTMLAIAREFKRSQQLKAFDNFISGTDEPSSEAQALLRGEKTIEEEISIFMPGIRVDHDLITDFVAQLEHALEPKKLGTVIRVITYDGDSSCVDVYLADFVAGLDAVRRVLPQFELPPGTTIEYTGGDLPLFDH